MTLSLVLYCRFDWTRKVIKSMLNSGLGRVPNRPHGYCPTPVFTGRTVICPPLFALWAPSSLDYSAWLFVLAQTLRYTILYYSTTLSTDQVPLLGPSFPLSHHASSNRRVAAPCLGISAGIGLLLGEGYNILDRGEKTFLGSKRPYTTF